MRGIDYMRSLLRRKAPAEGRTVTVHVGRDGHAHLDPSLDLAGLTSITLIKQVIRKGGQREAPQLAAYMDRNSAFMRRVLDGKELPPTVTPEDGITAPQKVTGACTSGQAPLAILNSVSERAADRIAKINERQVRDLRRSA